jgi:hypothetical protein
MRVLVDELRAAYQDARAGEPIPKG